MTRFALLSVICVIASCAPTDPFADFDALGPDACGADAAQGLVGQPLEAAAGVTAPGGVRRIGPEDLVTTDLAPERMNIWHDGTTITRITCS
ncbi:I78 family peptidase inhibitor [Gymnodinialimonas hymeniacidonis]|uniref:I78 family peptidase inhibitor n=1 Tax=Gymnodinialimonas hymeniacidonis TaxID=3126508 RepID=UPI0034C5F1EA